MADPIKFYPDGSRVPSLDQRIGALYVDGYSLREIARELDITFGEVRRAIIRQGVKLRKRGNAPYLFTPSQRRAMVHLYRDGYSGVYIARKYGTSDRNVYRILDKAGVPRRNQGHRGKVDA